ncbi:MAG TPA: hypothetical protein VGO47_07050 [Chlamydiales bacterium]|nr:hypothetical protein [Chlamydiales bacterium]
MTSASDRQVLTNPANSLECHVGTFSSAPLPYVKPGFQDKYRKATYP